eukprot:TRINITY_DN1540_c0_g5_i2.p1 TRINITY_DN1540_c0_g5~~TRINITY_DN1540_c0_g5_i2.p1  ORF type:complete len:931 (+),score=299.54 TRINITY_DN1540_c0_g5_i2:148-2940(+)
MPPPQRQESEVDTFGAHRASLKSDGTSSTSSGGPRTSITGSMRKRQQRVYDVRGSLAGLGGSFVGEVTTRVVAGAKKTPGGGGASDLPADMLEAKEAKYQPSTDERRVEELRQLFQQHDADGSGMIDAEELHALLPCIGLKSITIEQVKELLDEIDMNNDGQVDFDEFLHFYDVLMLSEKRDLRGMEARDRLASVISSLGGQNDIAAAFRERKKLVTMGAYLTDRQVAARARIYNLLYGLPAMAPDYVYRRWWDVVVLITILYIWVIPTVQIVKGPPPTTPWVVVDCAVTVICIVDVLVTLDTAVQLDDRRFGLVVDRWEIFRLYARSGLFITDVLGALPLDLIAWGATRDVSAWRVMRGLRLFKLAKFSKLFQMTDRGSMDPSFVRFYFWTKTLLRQAFVILVLLHLMTLLRMIVTMQMEQHSERYSPGENGTTVENCQTFGLERCTEDVALQYFYAFFWVWALLTTQGMATLEDEVSYAYAMVVMFMSLVLQGHVVANMSALVLKSNVEVQNQDAMRSTLAIMSHYNIPGTLQQEVLSFQYHSLQQNAAASLAHILVRLPPPLQREVGLYVKVDLITGVPMFKTLSSECRMALANRLQQTYAEPQDYIIKYGEDGAEMFFMMHGFADVLIPAGPVQEGQVGFEGRVVATTKRGDFFGEVALLKSGKRTASIQALTYCDLFRLHIQDFRELLEEFSELSHRMEAEARERGLISKPEVTAEVTITGPDDEDGERALGAARQLIHATEHHAPITAAVESVAERERRRSSGGDDLMADIADLADTTEPPGPDKQASTLSGSGAERQVGMLSNSQHSGAVAAACGTLSAEATDVAPLLAAVEERFATALGQQEESTRKHLQEESQTLTAVLDEVHTHLRETFDSVEKLSRRDEHLFGGLFGGQQHPTSHQHTHGQPHQRRQSVARRKSLGGGW